MADHLGSAILLAYSITDVTFGGELGGQENRISSCAHGPQTTTIRVGEPLLAATHPAYPRDRE